MGGTEGGEWVELIGDLCLELWLEGDGAFLVGVVLVGVVLEPGRVRDEVLT